jgi:hypothetical protein
MAARNKSWHFWNHKASKGGYVVGASLVSYLLVEISVEKVVSA